MARFLYFGGVFETARLPDIRVYDGGMRSADIVPTALDSLLDSVARCFDPKTARAIASLRQSETVQKRMEFLGAKASMGELSSDEKREYEALVEVGDVIATLQLKARGLVAASVKAQ